LEWCGDAFDHCSVERMDAKIHCIMFDLLLWLLNRRSLGLATMMNNERSIVLAKGNEESWKVAKDEIAGVSSNGSANMQELPGSFPVGL
jgi:hypothetical protein